MPPRDQRLSGETPRRAPERTSAARRLRAYAAAIRRTLSHSVVLCLTLSFSARAQAPNDHWRTLTTPHFKIHFDARLESVARRAAVSAERAYAKLSPLLKPARGRIDVAVTDHVDYSNGFAYVSPSPRMVVFARPPVDDRTLRFRDDWLELVVQHELVHVFQLDRTRGWWRAAQAVFGRQPLLFPNAWAPSWLLEGLAVHYESQLGDGGRVEGLAHVPFVNADALDQLTPSFGAWSSATLHFPGGTDAYVYGSFLVQEMGVRGGRGSVERFVERTSGRANPWSFERAARREFGVSFADAWKRFADSLTRAVRSAPPSPGTPLTPGRWLASDPRVAADGRVLFVAADGRDVTGLYEIPAAGGAARRVARRNTLAANVALADGRVVYAQGEWIDPWRMRSDLWMRERDGREHQLTHGARLFAPDARARDGAIVAVQNLAGTTRLVRVSDTGEARAITGASLDTTWSAPRWSHDGTRIAATRWTHGGEMAIVVLDSLGAAPRVLASARATVDDPAWTHDDRALLFSVNASGTAEIWQVDVASGTLRRVASGSTSLDAPAPTADGFIAVETRAEGERIVRVSLAANIDAAIHIPHLPSIGADVPSTSTAIDSTATAAANAPVEPYRPLRQLAPRYWLPTAEANDDGNTRYGALVSGSDIVERHAYAAMLQYEPRRAEYSGSLSYRYAGLGLPLVDVAARQTWDHYDIGDSTGAVVGTLGRRRRFAGAALTYVRQRARNAAAFGVGAEMEFRDFVTYPSSYLARLGNPLYLRTLMYPTFSAAASWANTRTPILAFGPEDGISLMASLRHRWRTDAASTTRSSTVMATAAAFKSMAFIPGPSHHVLALRGAIAQTDDRTNTELQAGGVSGASAELAPGVTVGDVRRTFFVRGFAPTAQFGTRALGAGAEWRAPLWAPNWGTGFVPFFAQRASVTAFADAGAAWCPAGSRGSTVACPYGPTPKEWMTSVGGELTLDAAVLSYDAPYRLRLGYARPMAGKKYTGGPEGSAYFSLGLSF